MRPIIKDNCKVQFFPAPEGDYRKIVLDKMIEMSNIEWTVDEDIHITWETPGDFNVDMTYKKGIKYHGIPYGRPKSNLNCFKKFVDGNGVFSYPNHYYEHFVGNNCSTSMRSAYQLILPMKFVGGMKPDTTTYPGWLAFPSPLYNPVKDFGDRYDSADVFNMNSKKAVFDAFAALKPADTLYKCKKTGSGHTRMVYADPVVVKKDDGTIDGEKSYVPVIEQTNCFVSEKDPDFVKNNGYDTTWWVDKHYTFETLWSKGFMPVTYKIFSNGDKPKDAFVLLENGSTKESLKEGKITGKVTSNFQINYLMATIYDKAGKVVANSFKYDYADLKEFDFSEFSSDLKLDKLPKGEYTYKVIVGIARGDSEIENIKFKK